jgi:hypothetical protein
VQDPKYYDRLFRTLRAAFKAAGVAFEAHPAPARGASPARRA